MCVFIHIYIHAWYWIQYESGRSRSLLTHWGWETHICVSKITIIGSDNGLLPGQCQAIIWSNAGILLIKTSGTNFSEILIEIHISSFNKMHLKISSVTCRPFCLGLDVLRLWTYKRHHYSQSFEMPMRSSGERDPEIWFPMMPRHTLWSLVNSKELYLLYLNQLGSLRSVI